MIDASQSANHHSVGLHPIATKTLFELALWLGGPVRLNGHMRRARLKAVAHPG
jgi:hypothetical protein